jgi:hypothetical protein
MINRLTRKRTTTYPTYPNVPKGYPGQHHLRVCRHLTYMGSRTHRMEAAVQLMAIQMMTSNQLPVQLIQKDSLVVLLLP